MNYSNIKEYVKNMLQVYDRNILNEIYRSSLREIEIF